MKKLDIISDNIKQQILKFLYQDEALNIFTIHYIENRMEDMGDLYIGYHGSSMTSIMHMKHDGHSYFTSFYTQTDLGLKAIAYQLKKINKKNILLAGKAKDIKLILKELKKQRDIKTNIFYRLNPSKFKKLPLNHEISLIKATKSSEDMNLIKDYLVGFFGVKTKEDIDHLTNERKILEDMKNGLYFLLNQEGKKIGMSRFFGTTKHYIDITTVYIDEAYRGHGFGKELMKLMVKESLMKGKLPITQTALNNQVAKSIYESIGFEQVSDYAFEFL